MKTALITGVTGLSASMAQQDGSFLAELAMWMMLPHHTPDDYVVATGESYSVREFLDRAAACLNLDWNRYVQQDPRYLRPTEVDHLLGDPSKVRRILGWKPRLSFDTLVSKMVDHDLKLANQERTLAKPGHQLLLRAVRHG
jgi:GDPmannose 4,6-dehydratase